MGTAHEGKSKADITGCFRVKVNCIFVRLEGNFLVLLLGEILCPVYVGDETGGL